MKVNKFKFLGAMVFVTILMDVVPLLGFLHIGNMRITNMHIPSILTAIVLGPEWGMCMGLLYGIISLMRAVSRGLGAMDLMLQNPLISILPRIIFPMLTGYLYRRISGRAEKKWELTAVGISAAVGTFLNSFCTLGAISIAYSEPFHQVLGLPVDFPLAGTLIRLFGPGLLVETAMCVAVSLVACSLLRKLPEHRTDTDQL